MRCHLCTERTTRDQERWGTLDKTGAQSDFTPFTATRCLKQRKESIHFNVPAPIP